MRWKSLCAAIKLLGCFDPSKTQFEPRTNVEHIYLKRGFDVFEKFFCTLDDSFLSQSDVNLQQQQQQQQPGQTNSSESTADSNSSPSKSNALLFNQMDEKLIYICYIMRLLYDTAIDSFDKYYLFFTNIIDIV